MKVADLYAAFSIRPAKGSLNAVSDHARAIGRLPIWQKLERDVHGRWLPMGVRGSSGATRMLHNIRGFALKAGVALSAGMALKKGFAFNSEIELAKTQVAGMMAIARKSSLSKELGEASASVERLNELATELPGNTMDYVKVMKQIAHPVLLAGASMKELEEVTVATGAAAKVMDVDTATSARSIMRLYQGNAIARDRVTIFLAEVLGMTVQELNAVFKTNKALGHQMVLRAANSKHVKDLLSAQNKTFKGQVEEFGDRVTKFLARVSKSMFDTLGKALSGINEWWKKNEKSINRVADAIGKTLGFAIAMIGKLFAFLVSGSDEANAVLLTILGLITAFAVKAAVAWLVALGPILLIVAAIALVAYGVMKLIRYAPQIRAAIGGAWDWVKDKGQGFVDWVKSLPEMIAGYVKMIGEAIRMWIGQAWDFVVEHAKAAVQTLIGLTQEALSYMNDLWDEYTGGNPLVMVQDAFGSEEGREKRVRDRMNKKATTNAAPGGMTMLPGGIPVPTASTAGAGAMSVQIGTIQIDAKNADAKEVGSIFATELAKTLRHAQSSTNGQVP